MSDSREEEAALEQLDEDFKEVLVCQEAFFEAFIQESVVNVQDFVYGFALGEFLLEFVIVWF